MNFNFSETVFNDFLGESKVWIYQSERPFNAKEITSINESIKNFTQQWTAHNQQLKATGCVIEDRFILLMVDETQAGASGCSIDKSVHFIQQLQDQFKTNLFNRLLLSYQADDGIKTISLSDLKNEVAMGALTASTIIFNTTIQTKNQFETEWMQAAGESWLKSRM